jgi:hypothetical protein
MVRDEVARHDTSTGDLPRISSPQWPSPVGPPHSSPHASENTSSDLAAASASPLPSFAPPPTGSRWLLTPSLDYISQQVINQNSAELRGMSNQQPPGSNPPGLPTTYPTTTSSYPTQGSGDMLATPYNSYSTSQPGDPYRTVSPGVSNSSHPLPRMRTFDPVSQQRPAPHGGGQAIPFGGQQPMPHGAAHPMHMPPESFPPYYSPMMGVNQPYGISPDTMVNRYNMPPDARYVGHRPGPKKVSLL